MPLLSILLVLAVVGVGASALPVTARAQRSAAVRAPQFRVDPAWPKPLPNRWLMGQAAGVAVDAQDHVWVIQRPRSLVPAPPVLEFDPAGNLLRAWGGPGRGYDWPAAEHGIFVDAQGHVWIGGNVERDHQVLKFTPDGKLLLQIGQAGVTGGDSDTAHLGRPASVSVDPATGELFVADGYKNHRVIVFDAQTGAYKRHWGANGRPPGDASVKSFGNPVHCVRLARDGLLYVCDRSNNRIQVFRRDGTFSRSSGSRPRRAAAARCGTWTSRTTRPRPGSTTPTARTTTSGRSCARAAGSSRSSGATGARRGSSTGCTTSPWTPGGTSTRPKWTPASASRSSSSRARLPWRSDHAHLTLATPLVSGRRRCDTPATASREGCQERTTQARPP